MATHFITGSSENVPGGAFKSTSTNDFFRSVNLAEENQTTSAYNVPTGFAEGTANVNSDQILGASTALEPLRDSASDSANVSDAIHPLRTIRTRHIKTSIRNNEWDHINATVTPINNTSGIWDVDLATNTTSGHITDAVANYDWDNKGVLYFGVGNKVPTTESYGT